eukprot:1346148-Amphidinium_carterae.1
MLIITVTECGGWWPSSRIGGGTAPGGASGTVGAGTGGAGSSGVTTAASPGITAGAHLHFECGVATSEWECAQKEGMQRLSIVQKEFCS